MSDIDVERMHISLFQIKVFLKTAEKKSFSNAAEELKIKQPAVSKSISGIEQTLGVKLIERKTRPVQLTAEGARLYECWKRLMEEYQQSLGMNES